MATKAAEMSLRCVFEGSISMQDMEKERRPYHRNCSCALHSLKGVYSNIACPHQRELSFPKKQSWGNCSLSKSADSELSIRILYPVIYSSICNKDNLNEDLSFR